MPNDEHPDPCPYAVHSPKLVLSSMQADHSNLFSVLGMSSLAPPAHSGVMWLGIAGTSSPSASGYSLDFAHDLRTPSFQLPFFLLHKSNQYSPAEHLGLNSSQPVGQSDSLYENERLVQARARVYMIMSFSSRRKLSWKCNTESLCNRVQSRCNRGKAFQMQSRHNNTVSNPL